MSKAGFAILMVIFSAIGLMVGTGILISEEPLRSMCQKGCWLNHFLYAIFGENGGKRALAGIWFLAASLCLTLAVKLKIKVRN